MIIAVMFADWKHYNNQYSAYSDILCIYLLFVQTKNLCSDLTYGIGYYCLDDKQTYVLGFKSLETCEKLRDELNQLPKESASINVNDCLARNELQALLNLETLTQVCIQQDTYNLVAMIKWLYRFVNLMVQKKLFINQKGICVQLIQQLEGAAIGWNVL